MERVERNEDGDGVDNFGRNVDVGTVGKGNEEIADDGVEVHITSDEDSSGEGDGWGIDGSKLLGSSIGNILEARGLARIEDRRGEF